MVQGPLMGGYAWELRANDAMRDAQARSKQAQREVDDRREEKLYVSDEYKVFFLTKQRGNAGDDRAAYISIRPFSAVPPGSLDELRRTAEPWDAAASQVRIEPAGGMLAFHDDITATKSEISFAELDPGVRQALGAGGSVDQAWNKIFSAAAVNAPASTLTIPVHRPLTFKKAL